MVRLNERGQYPSRGLGGPLTHIAALEDTDVCAASPQLVGDGAPDNATADDCYRDSVGHQSLRVLREAPDGIGPSRT